MQPIRRWANAHPMTTAGVVLAIVILYYLVPVVAWGPMDLTGGTGILGADAFTDPAILISQAISCVGIGMIVLAVGWWQQTGLTSPRDKAGMRWFFWITAWPFVFLALSLALVASETDLSKTGRTVIAILAIHLLVSLFEETLFRGVITHGLRNKYSEWRAFILGALIFGLFHYVNLATGQSIKMTTFQVIFAISLGLILGGLRLQTNSLWPPIFFHWFWNSAVSMAQTVPFEGAGTAPPVQTDFFLTDPALYVMPTVLAGLGIWMFARWQRRVTALP